MKRLFSLATFLLLSWQLSAQIPEDAIRMSWNPVSGTARSQAFGGAIGALGGDISTVFVNPAGLGVYKTGEFVVSPGLYLLNGNSDFRGTAAKADGFTKFNLGASGVVWSQPGSGRWGNRTMSFAVNRIANFNGSTFYQGANNYSSFAESFAEEFAMSGLPINTILYSAPLSLGTKLATYTYLIDTLTVNGGVEVAGMPQRNAILAGTDADLFQEKNVQTKGGITEIAFGYAGNMNDKFYLGGSIGVPIVNFERTTTLTETDRSGDNDNNFNYASYQENYRAQGLGVNARLGVIFRPVEAFRGGIAIHTPTLYGLRERTTGRMEADLEDYLHHQLSVATADSIYTQYGADIPEYRYDLVSPWKFVLSGAYVINGVSDVSQQTGFITADVEYVTHGSSRFHSAESGDDAAYYEGVNEGVKLSYKGAINVRLGGELKFNTFMTRLGFAYYGSPYKDTELKARRMNVSAGVGYRDRGMFIDLAYVLGLNRDVDFPYRLADKANTFAETRNNNGNLLLTVGFKF